MKTKSTRSDEQIAVRVSVITIIGNLFLALFKLIAALVGHSAALLSDAVHSLSDSVSTVIVIIGVKMAGKESDPEHPYGHERFECVVAIILAIMLAATGLGIGYAGLKNIIAGDYENLKVPGTIALVAAGISILSKEAMYWYTRAAAVKIKSGALMADAWHHRSDSLSSIGSFFGIFGARMGYPILDSVACLVISAFIIKVAYDIFIDGIEKMVDKACDDKVNAKIYEFICAQEGVFGVDLLRTRMFGNRIYVDVEICVDRSLSLCDAHDIAHQVHDAMEESFSEIKHCMVHVNPAEEDAVAKKDIYSTMPRFRVKRKYLGR